MSTTNIHFHLPLKINSRCRTSDTSFLLNDSSFKDLQAFYNTKNNKKETLLPPTLGVRPDETE
ncbi:CLUMA_CG012910, isoform A [Clunio marinus]|uniref:CLUMA_CG012910, isoform A n=1 Tax=Clunio marinus TaxID=568069 RepID=A0A1J1IKJ2_9DIPT|nr:CLUMA_CG012910, isoform A [Clunio marinus]